MAAVEDVIFVVVILFVVGAMLVFGVYTNHRVNDALYAVPSINDSVEAVEIINSVDSVNDKLDYVYLAGFVGLFLSIIIFGYFVGGYPILAPVYFVLVCVFTFIAIIFQFAWGDVAARIPSMIGSLPMTNYILSHLGYFAAVIGLVGIFVMYAKPGDSV